MDVSWQYLKRIDTYEDDIQEIDFNIDNISAIDFNINYVPKSNGAVKEINEFIRKYEWLGKPSLYPTHMFKAEYRKKIGGVVVMDMPIAFSKILGDDTRKIERLISRGACAGWTPKNLGSRMIMYSIRWMAKNTKYRLFTAYADPEAGELGTIYQACNFFYLGQKYGAKKSFVLPNGNKVSDRYFRSRSAYKRYAKEMGIIWKREWQIKDKIQFSAMPNEVEQSLRSMAKQKELSCESIANKPKHKYAYILGNNKKETNKLRKTFLSNNKVYKYPSVRGI